MGGSDTTSVLMENSSGENYERKQFRRETKMWKVGLILTTVIVVAAVTICMETVYILQLRKQQNVFNEGIQSRMESLEAKQVPCSCNSHPNMDQLRDVQKSMHHGMAVKDSSLRLRRSAESFSPTEDQLNETEHIRNEHHGIASSHIALLFADPEQLNKTSNAAIPTSLLKFSESRKTEPLCSKLMENGLDDAWCIPHHPDTQPYKFMIKSDRPHYPYFAKAAWMSGDRASENYEVSADEQQALIVKNPGIYIVTSNMHFTEISSGLVHYGVFVRDSSNAINSERVLGLCVASVPTGSPGGSIYPCSTWQLAPLKEGDRVFMRINPLAWFRVQKETFFLGLIKLNDFVL